MALVIVRHAERVDYVERRRWLDAAPRPWDTPITRHGHSQAEAAGAAAARLVEDMGLPPVRRMFTSPMLRCVETSTSFRRGFGASDDLPIHAENSLIECMTEDWYRSWAIEGLSDATWGGPKGYEVGTVPVSTLKLRPEAHVPSGELLLSSQELEDLGCDLSHSTKFFPAFTVASPEDHSYLGARLGDFAREALQRFPEETIVLVSHGGPSAAIVEYLTGKHCHRYGFTGLSVLEQDGDNFLAHVKASTAHLGAGEDLGFATAR